MGWKWPWQKSDSGAYRIADSTVLFLEHLRDLRHQVEAQIALVNRLVDQLAERDAQIRMVLEERFYRPVPAGPLEQAKPSLSPEDFNDVTQFDAGSDADWLKQADEILAKRASANDQKG